MAHPGWLCTAYDDCFTSNFAGEFSLKVKRKALPWRRDTKEVQECYQVSHSVTMTIVVVATVTDT